MLIAGQVLKNTKNKTKQNKTKNSTNKLVEWLINIICIKIQTKEPPSCQLTGMVDTERQRTEQIQAEPGGTMCKGCKWPLTA